MTINPQQLQRRIDPLLSDLHCRDQPRYHRLWSYYRNPMCPAPRGNLLDKPYRQAQEWGLPPRITGLAPGEDPLDAPSAQLPRRKEIVIENDIAWRIDTMVDYLFGKPLVIQSAAADPRRRWMIDAVLLRILDNAGGLPFFQELALAGALYGFVDVLVKLLPDPTPQSPPASPALPEAQEDGAPAAGPLCPAPADSPPDRPHDDVNSGLGQASLLERAADRIRLEIVEPARALPLPLPHDFRDLCAYAQVLPEPPRPSQPPASFWSRFRRRAAGDPSADAPTVEVLMHDAWLRLRQGRIIEQGPLRLGRIPLVHIQNTAAAFAWAGQSDVEPLIPLQDELNIRLCDRAHRISMQSFKMFLAKGIDNFLDQPVSPGRIWSTDNEQAQIQTFGGDSACPSEEAHIADLREALDKSSGVTPIAAGAIKNRIGRLTSAAALRITLLALLSRTDKKRVLYGRGIQRICELALHWLDATGLFPNHPSERGVDLHWPSPLPENQLEKLQEAQIKLNLGVDPALVRSELGY